MAGTDRTRRQQAYTSAGFPPPAERFCVLHGFAFLSRDGAKIERYAWGDIEKAWIAWPTANLREFADSMHISYGVLANHPEFSVERKAALMHAQNRGFRQDVIRDAVIARIGESRRDARRLARTIGHLEEIAAAGVAFARSHMTKRTGAGIVANPAVPVRMAKQCVDIAKSCADIIRGLKDLRDTAGLEDLEDEAAGLDPVPVLRDPGAKKEAGGGEEGAGKRAV